MTVSELIDRLQEIDGDAEVVVCRGLSASPLHSVKTKAYANNDGHVHATASLCDEATHEDWPQ